MTATHVNGIAVITDEPAPSPISRPGVNVTFEQIRHPLLADGAETYGCLHCSYVSDNINSIRGHLKAHNQKSKEPVRKAPKPTIRTATAPPRNHTEAAPRRKPAPAAKDLASLVDDLAERAQLTDQMRVERDAARKEAAQAQRSAADWKQRADDYRIRFEGMKNQAEAANRKLARVRALVK
ncbi:hypothetical protein [Streptomyces decoyicus]|uniref:hypothetical protein n=1 Tax=Streptomyces decoyicus TaxID=249567 RepID=UPI0036511306